MEAVTAEEELQGLNCFTKRTVILTVDLFKGPSCMRTDKLRLVTLGNSIRTNGFIILRGERLF